MKINSVTSSNYIQNYRSNKVTSTEKVKTHSDTDQVTFSKDVINFSQTLSAIKDQIEIRTAEEKARIGDIKNRIRSGQYNIDSNLVAEKILDFLV